MTAAIPSPPSGHRRDEKGSAAIEAAIGVPAFGLLVAMVILAGRVALAHQSVQAAAFDAARGASIERTQHSAVASGRTAARSSLTAQQLRCAGTRVDIDASAFRAPLGTTGQITTTVSCTVRLSDLSIPGVPGTRTITETARSPVDAFRERR